MDQNANEQSEIDALVSEAVLHRMMKDHRQENGRKAESLFRQCVERAPGDWRGHFGLASCLLSFRWDYSRKDFEEHKARLTALGVAELQKAVELAPDQPEPLLQLASETAKTAFDAAQLHYLQALQSPSFGRDGLFPVTRQEDDHFEFAIAAAESGLAELAVDAFCRANALNSSTNDKRLPPQPRKANKCWGTAMERLGKATWLKHDPNDPFFASVKK